MLASDVLYERRAIARHSRAGVLRVAPEGVEFVVRDGSPAPAPAPGEFGREDDGQLTGVVVDGRGDPLRRALVVIECACLEEPIEARTDDYGVYRVRRLPPGAYTIQAAWRRASASRVARLSGRARARVNFRLEQGDGTTRAGGRGSTRGATVSADPVSPGMGRRVDDELVRADAARPARPVGDVLDGSSPPSTRRRSRSRAPRPA